MKDDLKTRHLENDLLNIKMALDDDIKWWKEQNEKSQKENNPIDRYERGAITALEEFSNRIKIYFFRISKVPTEHFIKAANEYLREEVDVDRCIILEESIVDGKIDYVMYEDRFGRQWQIRMKENQYSKTEYVKE